MPKLPEQIADGVVGRKPLHAQQRMQRLIAAQPLAWAKRLAPASTAIRNAVNVSVGSMLVR